MAVIFGVASFLAGLASLIIFMASKGAIHEILSTAEGLVSAIFGVGCVLVYSLDALPDRIARAMTAEAARKEHVDRILDQIQTTPTVADAPSPTMGRSRSRRMRTLMLVLRAIIAAAVLYALLGQTAK